MTEIEQPTTPTTGEDDVERPERLKYYPDYIDDPEGLARIRQSVRERRGHDMVDTINFNSLGRLIDTIERLRAERNEASAALAAISPTTEDAVVPPVVPAYWNGGGKYSCAFGFEPGGLNFRIAGWQRNGTATLYFKDDDMDWDEDGYRTVEVANSELIAIRDKLNEIFPPEDAEKRALVECQCEFGHDGRKGRICGMCEADLEDQIAALKHANREAVEAERQAIVAWLDRDAAEYIDGGAFGKVAHAAVHQASRAIERGEHALASIGEMS